MLELLTAIALSMSLTTNPIEGNQIILDNLNLTSEEFESMSISTDSSLNNPTIVQLDQQYSSYFTSRTDYKYLEMNITETNYYCLSIACGMNVFVDVYLYDIKNNEYNLFTSYSNIYTSSNNGFNNGFYVDSSLYSKVCFSLRALVRNSNVYFIASVQKFKSHSNTSNEFIKYDVAKKLCSYEMFNYTDDNTMVTTGYNPTEVNYSFPSISANGNIQLYDNNSYNIDTELNYPYKSIGRMPGGSTGYLIGNNILATAAHCVFDYTTQEWYYDSDDMVYFGQNKSATSNTASAKFKYIYIESKYLNHQLDNNNTYFDWALCVLDNNCGESQGYLPIAREKSLNNSLKDNLTIVGYKNGYVYQTISNVLYTGNELFEDAYRKIDYTNNTAGGNSGSPIFDNNNIVIGIHVGGGAIKYENNGSTMYSKSGTTFVDKLYFLSKHLINGGTL